MAEYTTVSTGHTLKYQGYLNLRKLSKLLRSKLQNKGYDYFEVEHNEIVKKDGKDILFESDNEKTLSDDIKSRIKISLTATGVQDVAVELDGKTQQLQEVTLSLSVSAWLISDYEGRYHLHGWLFFLRNIYEKFFGVREINKFKQLIQRDHDDVVSEAKKYLNTYRL